MSISYIPESVKLRLWGKAAGRCEYDGCNQPLYLDTLTKAEFNAAYIAHIIGDSPGGPRGDKILSDKLKADITNLMLCCDVHHRLIDKQDVAGHSVERLIAMKIKHEARIELLTSLMENKRSFMIFYDANIGKHSVKIDWDLAAQAMLPNRYPADRHAIQFGLDNSSFQDNESRYWELERENLIRQFNQKLLPLIGSSDVRHFSIFAIGTQPLLIELGRLMSDIPAADVYQLHREPPDWKWQDHPDGFRYNISEPSAKRPIVALKLSFSATIEDSRITSVIGNDVSIWSITIEKLGNDFLKSREQLRQFRECFRGLLDRIKATHGEHVDLHVFPAVPVAIAVEIGRVWMPKADLPLIIYDQNRSQGGFIKALEIRS